MMFRVTVKTYGYPSRQWLLAKEEARKAMIIAAKNESTIYYSDLVKDIFAIRFDPHDFKLFHLLGQISTEESVKGRGMLTAVVVRQDDGQPGLGFFVVARNLGLGIGNQDEFWISELRKVFNAWEKR